MSISNLQSDDSCDESIEKNPQYETVETPYEFTSNVHYNYYTKTDSPQFVLNGTNMYCCVEVSAQCRNSLHFLLKLPEDYKNICVKTPKFKSISWSIHKHGGPYRNVKINENNPTYQIHNHSIYSYDEEPFVLSINVVIEHTIKNFVTINDVENITLKNVQNMYENMEFADVKIIVADKEFSAHKAILVGNPVFAKMFTNNMREKNENIVYIKEMDPEVFTILLRFLYLGTTGAIYFQKQGVDFIINLINAANMYEMEYLKNQLIDLTVREININNVIDILILSDRFNIPKLQWNSMRFMKTHCNEIAEIKKFQDLIELYPELTGQLLMYICKNSCP